MEADVDVVGGGLGGIVEKSGAKGRGMGGGAG